MAVDSKPKVLIVEDEEDIRDILKEILSMSFDVVALGDGTQALKRITMEKFDAIVSDLRLPGASGFQIAASVRNSEKNRTTPLYIVSGFVDRDAVEKAEALGVAHIINKPCDGEDLMKKISLVIEGQKRSNIDYDERIIKGLNASIQSVMTFYLDEEPKLIETRLSDVSTAQGYLVGIIELFGNTTITSLTFIFSQGMIQTLASKVFPGVDLEVDKALETDLAGEICNQLGGRLKAHYLKLGVRASLGLPRVIVGSSMAMSSLAGNAHLYQSFRIGNELLQVEFMMHQVSTDVTDQEQATDSLVDGGVVFD